MDGYERLANEIILLAVKDYRGALRKLKHNPHSRTAQDTVDEVERFFRSDWYKSLTEIDGEMLIRKLREEAEQ